MSAARGADHAEAAVPLQPMEIHGGAEIHLQPTEEPTLEYVDVAAQRWLQPHGKSTLEQGPGRTCGPMERVAHTRAGFLAGFVTP